MLEGEPQWPRAGCQSLQDKDRFQRGLGEGLNPKKDEEGICMRRVACHRVSQHLRGVSRDRDTPSERGREKPGGHGRKLVNIQGN